MLVLCAVTVLGTVEPSARATTPTSGAKLCVFVKPTRTAQAPIQAVNAFENTINRTVDVHRVYDDWNTKFPGAIQDDDAHSGRIPFIDWKGRTSGGKTLLWNSIARGNQDATIRARARGLKRYGHLVYLSFHHEPENNGGTAASFVAAWRHIHSIFEQVGATNVRFVWTMMAYTFDRHAAGPWYPGRANVDYVGADGYSWYPGRSGSKWRSFDEIFTPAYRWAVSHHKQLIVGETGVQEDPRAPLRKKNWFIDALATTKTWSDLAAFCYFDSNQIYLWRVTSSDAALTGFRTLANDPYLGG